MTAFQHFGRPERGCIGSAFVEWSGSVKILESDTQNQFLILVYSFMLGNAGWKEPGMFELTSDTSFAE